MRAHRRPRRWRAATAVLLCAGAVIGISTGAFAGGLGTKIGEDRVQGENDVAVASGDAFRPRVLLVRVTSRPPQVATGNYVVVCAKGSRGVSTFGDYVARTPFVRRLKMSFHDPRKCSVIAAAQLRNRGNLKVQLYAKR